MTELAPTTTRPTMTRTIEPRYAAVLRPRSLIIDFFAEYIRHRSGTATALTLTRLAELFGIPEPTTRVTLSRMKKQSWLDGRRNGKNSYYGPTPRLTKLIDDGQDRILQRRITHWDQRWDIVLYTIPETDRARRDHLRSKLEWLGYGQFSPGCWLSPHRINHAILPALDETREVTSDEIEMFHATTLGLGRDEAIARRCWPLEALNADYEEFHNRRNAQLAALRKQNVSDQAAFIERVYLIAEYRRFPFRDPDLPTELLPRNWIGRSAHSTFLEVRELLRAGAFRHYDTVAT